jgi:hypothetical protein
MRAPQGPKDSLEYRVFFKQGCEWGPGGVQAGQKGARTRSSRHVLHTRFQRLLSTNMYRALF